MTRKALPIFLALALLSLLLAGCQSHEITVVIRNKTSGTIRDIEIDYPAGPPSNGSQSFGTDHLDTAQQFQYSFKPTGDGLLRLRFLDTLGHTRDEPGPEVHAGDRGEIFLNLAADGRNEWRSNLMGASNK